MEAKSLPRADDEQAPLPRGVFVRLSQDLQRTARNLEHVAPCAAARTAVRLRILRGGSPRRRAR